MFYRVNRDEFAFGILEEKALGLNVNRGSGNAPLVSDKGLTWVASSAPSGQLSLIYGAILNPEITQVIVISEASQSATIVESKGVRLWFLILESPNNDPITLKATNQEGAVLYKYGDSNYWGTN